jgi:hypothetical protein
VHSIGPELVSAASANDPTNVGTAAAVGAATGYQLAWVALLVAPLLGVVQTIAAHVGSVAGGDLQTLTLKRCGRATSLGAAPEVFAASPGSLFAQMALASMAGRAIGGTVSPTARERTGATSRAYPPPSPSSPGDLMTTTIAAEISELAEVLGKLGVLRDSGVLTDEEFQRAETPPSRSLKPPFQVAGCRV